MENKSDQPVEKKFFEKYFDSAKIGTCRVAFTFGLGHPFDLLKTKMQANPFIDSGYLLANDIYKKSGIRGFYTGGLPNFSRVFFKETYRSPIRGAAKNYFNNNLPTVINSDVFINFFTGLTMTFTDNILICPLERLKVWMMTNYVKRRKLSYFFTQQSSSSECVKQLFKGATISFVRGGISWTSFLIAEEEIRKEIMKLSPRVDPTNRNIPLFEKFIIGSLTGIVNSLAVLPVDSIKTQVQKSGSINEKKLFNLVKLFYKRYGIRGFYSGWQFKLPHYIIVSILTSHVIQEVDNIWEQNQNRIE